MDTAGRYVQGQEMLRGNVNYVEEIEELRHQINMLKLGVGQPEIIQLSANIPPLNQPYEQRSFGNRSNGPRGPSGYWKCGETGHIQFNCPNTAAPIQNNNNNNRNRGSRNNSRGGYRGRNFDSNFRQNNNQFRCGKNQQQNNQQSSNNNDQQLTWRARDQQNIANIAVNRVQSTPPIKEYNIVPDVWNTHAHRSE